MQTSPEAPRHNLQSVMLATDLSATAQVAQDWAVEIAAVHQARLHLVHAVYLAGWATDYLEIDASVPAGIEETCREKLQQLARDTPRRDLDIACDLLNGEPSEAVLGFASQRRTDLIVVGTRGHRGLDSLLLGSTARRIVQRATCPVLSVHPRDTDHMRPVRRILVATDFSSEAAAAMQAAARLLGSDTEDAEIILLHAYLVPYDLLPADGFVSAATGLKQWQTAQTDVERRLALGTRALPESAPSVVTRGVEGYPPDIIVEQAKLHDVDLIAMGTHGRTGLSHAFLGSIAEKVIHRAPCPVLTVRCDPNLERNGGPHARREAEEISQ